MSRLSVVVLLLVVSFSSFAGPIAERDGGRHFILEPDHPLRDDEKADLAARGVEMQDVVAGGRYLVRVSRDAKIEGDSRIRSLEAITIDRKLQRSAYVAARGRAFAPLFIVFHRDASIDEARQVIEGVGGTILNPLAIKFQKLRSLRAMIPSTELRRLAGNESVRAVVGFGDLKRESHNMVSAGLSNVTPLQTAPYNLTGAGVTITYFELGPADTRHPEFQGRLTTHFDNTNFDTHATHVAGTMSAAGLDPRAKGMAPAAVVHQYLADDDFDFLDLKEEELPRLGSAADNNSWGYILGWCQGKALCPDALIWTGGDDLIGGYFVIDAALDAIAREQNVLMVHSAGNDGQNPGPTFAPFSHEHLLDGHDEDKTFCYSVNGSGTDCPASCTGNDSFGNPLCEITRHPVNAPFLSVGLTASSKNIITVGATDFLKNITSYSSRGPTRDGRVKPDVVARGGVGTQTGQVYSTFPNGIYGGLQGTSMSTPVVTGIAALLTEQWRKTFNNANPLPATIKALLIGTAEDRGNAGPDYTFGFGFVNAQAAADLIIADGGTGSRIKVDSVRTGQQLEIPLTVSATQNLRATLVWSDPEIFFLEGEFGFPALVNDLDLKIIDPAGNTVLPYVLNKEQPAAVATRGVNTIDNVEVVEIANAPPGTYRLVVSGKRVAVASPQQFSLVANLGLGGLFACSDAYEPNESDATAAVVFSGTGVSGRLCTGDTDVFKALVTAPGPISVTVTAGDTPLRVSLSGSSISGATVDVPAGASRTVTATSPGAGEFFVRVMPSGAIGADPSYRLSATFPITGAVPRRSVRH